MKDTSTATHPPPPYTRHWEPKFHFAPARNWMNDPNGLIFFEGEYHLFFQYNPHGSDWGHMSWGHAVSSDLVHWDELSVAIHESDFMVFSGSVVIDWDNRSGLGDGEAPPMIALFTAHRDQPANQSQHLAFSHDHGRSWTHYADNPILDLEDANFRDPKVFWHEPTNRWVMVVALAQAHEVLFFSSRDLLVWVEESRFGPAGEVGGQWECPDIIELPVEGEANTMAWVLKIDVDKNFNGQGSGAQYFTGSFDGRRFLTDSAAPKIVDFGPDFYACANWNELPDEFEAPVWIGWTSNHLSGRQYPTEPWRGEMSVPRQLSLRREKKQLVLRQFPIQSIFDLFQPMFEHSELQLRSGKPEHIPLKGDERAFHLKFVLTELCAPILLSLVSGSGQQIQLFIDPANGHVSLTRENSDAFAHPEFPGEFQGIFSPKCEVEFDVFVDTTTIEVFADGGTCTLTQRFFFNELSRMGIATQRSATMRNFKLSVFRNER